MTDASTSSESSEESRVARAARTVATLARRLSVGVAVLAAGSALAGGGVWLLLWWPPRLGLFSIVGAGATGFVLVGPAVTLGLFYLGLRDLLALPDRLSERTSRTLEQSAEAVRSTTSDEPTTVLGRLWGIVKQVWALRTVLLENRALLARYGTLIRFVTPGFLLLVVLATALSLVLVPLGIVVGLVALIW